jgi:hypothetical protein
MAVSDGNIVFATQIILTLFLNCEISHFLILKHIENKLNLFGLAK